MQMAWLATTLKHIFCTYSCFVGFIRGGMLSLILYCCYSFITMVWYIMVLLLRHAYVATSWESKLRGTWPTQGELATSMTAFMATAMWHLGQVTLLDDAGLKGVDLNKPLGGPTRNLTRHKKSHMWKLETGREIWNGKFPKTTFGTGWNWWVDLNFAPWFRQNTVVVMIWPDEWKLLFLLVLRK